MRQVTERDFRKPEFIDAKPEDYEFRGDGAVVRKDRWEQGIRSIAAIFGVGQKFEIVELVSKVEALRRYCLIPGWIHTHITETEDGRWEAWDETEAGSLGVYDKYVWAMFAVLCRAKEVELENTKTT